MLEEDGEAFLNIDRTLHGSVQVKGGKKGGKRINPAEAERLRLQAERRAELARKARARK